MSCPKDENIKRLERQNSDLRQCIHDLQETNADMRITIDGLKEKVHELMEDK